MIDEPSAANQRVCSTAATGCSINGVNPSTVSGSGPGVNYSASGNPNVFQGSKAPGENAAEWIGVPIDPPGTANTRVIRITNVRANANQLGVSSTLVPTQIIMFISMTGSTSIPINNPSQIVAFVLPSITFAVSGAGTNTQCTSSSRSVTLTYTERFATAFKKRSDQSDPATVATQNVPGAIYNTETGFYNPLFVTEDGVTAAGNSVRTAGRASQGTRLRAIFAGTQAGVTLAVSTVDSVNSSTHSAVLVNTDVNGAGAYSAASSGTLTVSGGGALAVWEVTGATSLVAQAYVFTATYSWTTNLAAGIPGLGQATVGGSYAPAYSTSTSPSLAAVSVSITTDNQPRFADTASASNTLNISPCVCNLLFPYVTNQGGFDTGLVVANTTVDPFGTAAQTGTVTINYYGSTTGGGAAPPAQVSAAVPAGGQLIWSLSSGGNFGVAATPGFQGYIITQSRFQYCHGFAFVSDFGASKLSHGYLALVIDPPGLGRGTAIGESLGQ